MFRKISLLVVSSISVFAMNNVAVNIDAEDVEIGLGLDIGQYNESIKPDTTFVGVRYLKVPNNTNGAAQFINRKYFAEVNFLLRQEIKDTGLKIGLGMKTNFSAITGAASAGPSSNASFMSMPLGIGLSYPLPLKDFLPVEVSAKAYYAPQALSFLDASSFNEYRLNIKAEVIERGFMFVGYRYLNYRLNSNKHDIAANITYNEAIYFGFKFEF